MVRSYELVNVLLYLASDRGRKSIPFNWLVLTAEIAEALEGYLTNQTVFLERFVGYRNAESFAPAWFEDSFNKWLENLISVHGLKLNPSLRDLIKETLVVGWEPKDGPSDGYNTNGVNRWRQLMIQTGHFSDIYGNFTWTVPDAEWVAEFIERELGEETRNHCQGIADLIKKCMERDTSHQ